MARDDRIRRRRRRRRSRSNNSSDSSARRTRRTSSSRRSGGDNSGSRKRSRYYDDESSSSTDEDNSNIDDDDDIIWLEDDNSRRSRPLRKAIENSCKEFNDREYSRRIFKFILQHDQLEGYRFYTGRNKRNIQEIRSTKELEAHIYEIYESKRRERRKKEMNKRSSSSSSRDITMKKKRSSSREGRLLLRRRRRRSQRRRKSNSSKRSYSDSNSDSNDSDSEEEDDIEIGTRTSQQRRRRRRGGGLRSSSSRNINESPERSGGKTSIKKTSTSVSTGGESITYLTSSAFRLFVRKTVPKFDGGPYSRDIFKHIKRKTKEIGLPIVIMKYRGEGKKKEVDNNNKSELMDAINNIYEEERYMLLKAESTHIYFDYPNHPGTKTWEYAVRMVVAADLTSNFDKQTLTKIHNRLPNAADNHISYFVGRPPTCVNATKDGIIERSYKQYEIEKRQLQRQLDDGYLQRYRVLGNAFWRALARKKCSTWIGTKCGQCRRAITTVQCCMKVKQQTCCSKIRKFCRTDPKTGQDVYQKIAKSLEITIFGHTSAWPLIIVLGCAVATLITIIIYHVLKKIVFNALSWERCAVFVDTTICGGANLGGEK